MDRFIWIGIAALAIVAYVCFKWYLKRKMKMTSILYGSPRSPLYGSPRSTLYGSASPYKRSLDDVIDNPDYMSIDMTECFDHSTIDKIYVKYDFINEVYSYFHQLQSSNNDGGCFGIGRWILDSETKQYSISLEKVILPGDDAVFNDNVIEFGLNIKLKMLQELRRLRKETQLQYDSTCWIHFKKVEGISLNDEEKKMQASLRHPYHPFFHVAIVVDASSPTGKLGIYNYQQQAGNASTSEQKNANIPLFSMSNTEDLKKTFSLDEWHKWAMMDISNDPLMVNLSIEGTEYGDVEVKVTDPQRTIRQQIENIIRVFELPTNGYDGRPIEYFLGKMMIDDNWCKE